MDSASREELAREMSDHLSIMNYNPMNDVIFKFIFGKEERKDITIDFLNTILEEELGHPICDIEFQPSEYVPEHDDDKLARLDLVCTLDTGELVDVEVQVVNCNNMQRRTMYYWAHMYLASLGQGDSYQDLRPCITINLLRFNLLPQDDPVSMWSIYNPKTGDRFNKDLSFHFLELPKFVKLAKKPIRDMTKMERWLAYFANKLTKEEKEELIMSEPAIRNAMDAAGVFPANAADRHAYVNREMAILDYNSNHKAAYEEGQKNGVQIGENLGKDSMSSLISILASQGKIDELIRIGKDKKFRNQLLKQYGL